MEADAEDVKHNKPDAERVTLCDDGYLYPEAKTAKPAEVERTSVVPVAQEG